jgi:hypothetical protein
VCSICFDCVHRLGQPYGCFAGIAILVISNGAHGYLALYRFVPELDKVFAIAIRSLRELSSRRYTNAKEGHQIPGGNPELA